MTSFTISTHTQKSLKEKQSRNVCIIFFTIILFFSFLLCRTIIKKKIIKIVKKFKHILNFFPDSWVEVICDKQIQLSSIISAHTGAGFDATCKSSHTTGGHVGYNRTCELLTGRYYWKGMCEEIRDIISRCD